MALSKFANNFLVGADPEIVLMTPPDIIRVGRDHQNDETGYYGFDHGGYVVEPHPLPNPSARQVCNNIRDSLDFMYHKFGKYKFRAGAFVAAPQREVTLGGHVHLDLPELSRQQIQAMDVFHDTLVGLDILPRQECERRCGSGQGYGRKGDVRTERGRVEYRSLCSWLFSRKTSMLALTGIKLCAVAPKTLPKTAMTSIKELTAWIEGFQNDDDDARWIIEKGYFDTSMEAKPDTEVTTVWKSCAVRGRALLDRFIEEELRLKKATVNAAAEVQAAAMVGMAQAARRQVRAAAQAIPMMRRNHRAFGDEF